MVSKVKSAIGIRTLRYTHPVFLQSLIGRRGRFEGADVHIRAAVEWLKRAIAATGQCGVAAHYSIGVGWGSGYPETTGYIVPTLIAVADRYGDDLLKDTTVRLADWLLTTQKPSGGFPGGEVRLKMEETVFNTGQIIRGLVSVWKFSGNQKYLDAAIAGAEWLLSVQSEDGAWRKFTSPLTTTKEHSYDVLTSWGLYQVGIAAGQAAYCDAARKQYEWTLQQQQPNGFFMNAGFDKGTPPLTHSMAYVAEGTFEMASVLSDDRGLDACVRFIEPLVQLNRRRKGLPGRIDVDYSSVGNWSCVTGNIQFGWMACRIGRKTGNEKFVQWGRTMIEDMAATQPLNTSDKGINGGVFGSEPMGGKYFPFTVLNWATKYLIDALMSL